MPKASCKIQNDSGDRQRRFHARLHHFDQPGKHQPSDQQSADEQDDFHELRAG